jgi:2-phospho-L-lactate guanylyltransferase
VKAILIPVKEYRRSKKRLAEHICEEARAMLVAAMCEDVFSVVAKVRGQNRVFVVSAEKRALDSARGRGWDTIVETEQISESHSVDMASRRLSAMGVSAVLRLPIDIPLAEPADIEAILSEAYAAPSAVIVPSRDGTGTNALLRAPPDLFPSHFGPGSFALHLAEAERCGARVKILRNPRLAVDIDEIDDLRALLPQLAPDSATARWLSETNLFAPGG